MPSNQAPSRRTILKTTGAALASASLAGCISSAAPQSATGATEQTTESTFETDSIVTVIVGPDGNLSFEPAHLSIRPGTTVRWVWKSDNHNIVVADHPEAADWQGTPGPSSKLYDANYRYEHTFTTKGTFEYYCKPHRAGGMVGEITVTETPTTTETTQPDSTTQSDETTDDYEPTEVLDARHKDEVTVAVGPSGKLLFDPETVRISAETTVTWVWKSDNHNIVPESTPDGATWKGTQGDAMTTYNEGHTYTHTFTNSGTYEYVCSPHKTAGMKGTLRVE